MQVLRDSAAEHAKAIGDVMPSPVESTCWMAEVPRSMMRVTSPVLRMRCQRRSRSIAFWNTSTLMDLHNAKETSLAAGRHGFAALSAALKPAWVPGILRYVYIITWVLSTLIQPSQCSRTTC